jgi:hypothetical protein
LTYLWLRYVSNWVTSLEAPSKPTLPFEANERHFVKADARQMQVRGRNSPDHGSAARWHCPCKSKWGRAHLQGSQAVGGPHEQMISLSCSVSRPSARISVMICSDLSSPYTSRQTVIVRVFGGISFPRSRRAVYRARRSRVQRQRDHGDQRTHHDEGDHSLHRRRRSGGGNAASTPTRR